MAKGKLAIGAAVAAVAGFVTGVLLAPKSGKETRQEIKDGADKAKKKASAEVEHLKKEVSDKASKAKAAATEKVEEVKSKAEKVAKDVSKKADDVKSRLEKAVEGAQDGVKKKPLKKK